jgi:lipopolysaccharide transport system permease protein
VRQSAPMSAPTVRATAQPAISIVIAPRRGRAALDLRELWAHRELIYFFVWRDTKVRYRQTIFGVLWAILQPLALMAVFSLFLGRLQGIAPGTVPYPVFALAGLVPWTLFSRSLLSSSESLVGASNLIQKVYFPRLLLPIAALGSQLVDFAIAMAILLVLLVVFGFMPTIAGIWIVPLTILMLVIALGVGTWLAALNVRYRDIRQIVPLLVQIWLFASPVAYSSALIPPQWTSLYYLNPVAGVIDAFRWALIGDTAGPPLAHLAVSVAIAVLLLVVGLAYFRRVERTFADVI